jgi:5-methylcytosine-specific restriction enzyme subunit McrC
MLVPMPVGVDSRGFSERVMKIAESIPFPAFRMSKGKLCAAEVVGTIQVGKFRLNILPKTDVQQEDRDADFLVNILRTAGYLRRSHTTSGTARATTHDPMEIMIAEVAAEITAALKDGAPRRYQEVREDSHTLKGRIDFTLLATRLPSEIKVPIRYTPLTVQNDLSQCLLWLTIALSRVTRSSSNRQHLRNLVARLGPVWHGGHNIPVPTFAKLRLSPAEARWERAVAIAKLLAKDHFIDPTYAGDTSGFTMLFPLQHLFERAMRLVLTETLQDDGITVRHRTEPLYLLRGETDGDDVLRLKPDYLLCRGDRILTVADAKWKRLTEGGRAYGARREDFYQVNAYLDMFEVDNAVVMVPRAPWMSQTWISSYIVTHNGRKIHLVAIDIEKLVHRRTEVRRTARAQLRDTLLNFF